MANLNEPNTEIINENSDDSETESEEEEIILDAKDMDFTSKETYYFKMVDRYFKNASKENIITMVDIINSDSKISLRLLDWFVTRNANKKTTYTNEKNKEMFNVHISYKAQLKSYKKRYFDPFRRRKKFNYSYDKDDESKKLFTTIGQLNFFRWAFSNNIIEYIQKNFDTITYAMVNSNRVDKKRKEKNSKEIITLNKDEIIITAEKKIVDSKMKILLSFN